MTSIKQRSRTSPRHPLATVSVVSIEAWERFSFYGMQAILAYYLYYSAGEGGLGIDKAHATALIGAYGALVYLCTFAGGWISDHLLGPEKTLLGGATILCLGHLILSLIHPVLGLALGLSLIALGSGLLKTAAITILGAVYSSDSDSDREVGFQFFYLGIQVAAVLGPLLTGWLALTWGFHLGFLAAALLMFIGMGIYLLLRTLMLTRLNNAARTKVMYPAQPYSLRTALPVIAGALALLAVLVGLASRGSINPHHLAVLLLAATASVAVVLFVTVLRSAQVSESERTQVWRFVPIFIASVCFWAMMNQTYGVLAVYSDIRLNRSFLGFIVPAAWTQSLNPLFVIVFSAPVTYIFARLGNRAPSSANKLSIGVMITALSFLVFIPHAGGTANSTPLIAVVFAIWIAAMGELFCGPIGMAATAAHAPNAFRTQFSALFFLTLAIGTALAGTISRFYDPSSAEAEIRYFLGCAVTGLVVGALTLVATRSQPKSHSASK
ncbi:MULTISPECIES: peptide MFS transporter [unclassified Corynebacterium]|uniref:peptide MFS transporter n=1 Tax=unclassified Corynebacterium TaxID=2624378 RepID=UPI0021674A80|nr:MULTISPECIES: oligopeptide:H+ symporter [unclassified Corynebacterium]MCS4491215.1 oligopeptide:H+ symporter [Corynebacterium sp. ES2715-CONJ3]MCS4530904.1 oligopeptide:H+ symporter [Corynebacterium sp. ES2730-CONJ]